MSAPSLNRVEIDLTALHHNYSQLKEFLGDKVAVMGMVKSDAYGHGLLPVAQTLWRAGARIFGVAEVEEGAALREAGVEGEVVVLLGAPPESFASVIEQRLSPVVYDLETLASLSSFAAVRGKRVRVHLKVDIGMGRLGVMPNELEQVLAVLPGFVGLELAGFFGHFPMADAGSSGETLRQLAMFKELVQRVRPLLPPGGLLHSANSAALLRYPDARFDMVRPGISLYGCYPSASLRESGGLNLKPVMSFRSRVVQIKTLPAGHGVSYGQRHITSRPTRIAVLPVGYDDGYLRRLVGKAQVLIRGCRVPVLGMICMNACMADVTDLPQVEVGDEVVLMGEQGCQEISADEIAAWSDTISYEILCLFGGRNRKVYVQ